MSRPTTAVTQLTQAQEHLKTLEAGRTKAEQLQETLRSQLDDPSTTPKPLLKEADRLAEQLRLLELEAQIFQSRIAGLEAAVQHENEERLHQERAALVEKAKSVMPEWAERIEVAVDALTQELQAFYQAVKPGVNAMWGLQANENPPKRLLSQQVVHLPRIQPADGHWIAWEVALYPVDWDPQATKQVLVDGQAEQERRDRIEQEREEAQQKKLEQRREEAALAHEQEQHQKLELRRFNKAQKMRS